MKQIMLPQKILSLMNTVENAGGEIYVVGGAVRDVLLNREVKDWDLTTSLTPEEMAKIFPKNSFYNNDFGTFSVVGKNKEVFEITTYRTEREYDDMRHPSEVSWGKSLKEDCQRRDFTINAIALDSKGNIYDYYGGISDLENKLIRTVGKADERFREDALRMLRAIRIAGQTGFVLEKKTFESIVKNNELINKISKERIRDEFLKILKCDSPSDGIVLLKNSKLLDHILPELKLGVGMAQKGHHIYDVWEHSLRALNNCESKNPITRLATLIHDIAKPVVARGEGEARTFHNHEVVGSRIANKIAKRLVLTNKQTDLLFRLVRWHMFTVEETQTDKAVRRFIKNVGKENIDEMIALRRSDRLGSGSKETSWRWELFKKRIVEVQKQPFAVTDLKINGEDVMKILKIKPSRKVGEVLDKLFAQVEEKPELNVREILMEKIKSLG
jgi:tRNA nucleotidyltransferase/poly(A) polymerase